MSTAVVVNTTPHAVMVQVSGGTEIITIPSNPEAQLRCEMDCKLRTEDVLGCKTVAAGRYVLKTFPEILKTADVVVVSTIIAAAADEIRAFVGRDVRVVVPDSGPRSVVRDTKGGIAYVSQFLEY